MRRLPSTLALSMLGIVTFLSVSTASAQALLWENRGQADFTGSSVDLESGGNVVVSAGDVGDAFTTQWFVRGLDRGTGATLWEDRFGPMSFGLAKDAAVEGERAFVAGWILTGLGFEFVVRAYDLKSGDILWSRQINRGPQCVEEVPGFARCVAKTLTVDSERVYVAGHLTRSAARSDFAILAFDAKTGALLWESVTDSLGTGANDYAWAITAQGDRLFVLGEFGDLSGLLLQAHDARTGAIRWRTQVPGATNATLKETLGADRHGVFIAGMDEQFHFFVQAYAPETGVLRWEDRVDDEGQIGQAVALTVGAGRLFALGVSGCDPFSFLDCELAVRAYDPRQGLVWQRADVAEGGDWLAENIAAGAGTVFVGGNELLESGAYHPTVRAYEANGGDFQWSTLFDDGNGYSSGDFPFAGFVNEIQVHGGQLLVGGQIHRADGGTDALVRQYETP